MYLFLIYLNFMSLYVVLTLLHALAESPAEAKLAAGDPMTQSIYGSLDVDSRHTEQELTTGGCGSSVDLASSPPTDLKVHSSFSAVDG